ncbi:hypothetical protein EI42_03568 [Thermosporothrix hazakensis]|jgi:hypothetical protein|uniref:Uncharacterized protein n=2 Tax=Thermosporothrix hazakensis TaxID=644383 RepID=A0A326U5B7_THEHA|nr:hypothetical protein EI42_03568 [Thermosporothrix hazakensis]GCE45647.1 hypothetical protein KTH_05160 [Thermosporothrix hazakensis]
MFSGMLKRKENEKQGVKIADWHTLFPRPITSPDDAVALVNTLGFCTWGPISRLDFPNLADHMGETAWSVLDRTWTWKDDLHFEQRLYYAKLIAGQPSFLSPDFLPDFIAALGEGERDPFRLYLDGRLSRQARDIYEYLSENPVQPTRDLRRGLRLNEKSMKTVTERALLELQRRFLICKVDLTGRTRGTYSYIWDLAERYWPSAFEQAKQIEPEAARERIRERLSVCGIQPDDALEQRLFLWRS